MDTSIVNNKLKCPISLKWTIPEERLKELKDKPGKYFRSGWFDDSTATEYYTSIYPNEEDDDKLGETWIYLFFGGIEREAKYNIKIESANFVSDENILIEECYGTRICTTEELLDPEKGFIVDGKLTIKMDGFFMTEMEMPEELQSFGDHSDALYLGLWNQESKKDFTVVIDGNEIAAHKSVLAARSPVFAKMFESGMKEAQENKVIIKDFSFEIVENAIKLCYHQSLVGETTLEDTMRLLQFFDKYDMQLLKDGLEKYMISVINELTVCRLTNAALISNALKLKMKCTEFLRKCMKTKPVCDLDLLDKDFIIDLFEDSFYSEVEI
uniref:BTB domain-containing protein n=1 Tax=Panagrolaimus davidi TaxID=227884 RepID=A0A914Q327_9BILA